MSKMTNEEKQLLFVDLCARLPHKVKAQYFNPDDERLEVDSVDGIDCTNPSVEILLSDYGLWIEEVKPYLRSMSSMTEEEKEHIKRRWCYDDWIDIYDFLNNYKIDAADSYDFTNWLNEHHFDYNNLIEKGLALEAPEGMYN